MAKAIPQESTGELFPIVKYIVPLLAVIILITLLFTENTQHISDRMFWLDEVQTFNTVDLPFGSIAKDAAVNSSQMQPPLFYWLGHFVSLLGKDPLTLRSLSVGIYVLMIGFALFFMRELSFPSRAFLGFVLIMSPFGAYATTEFRPYALAALSILISSVLLYRSIKSPGNWRAAILYSLAALSLQYSLTLNCFVFGVQASFSTLVLFNALFKERFQQFKKKYMPLLVVTIFLCAGYISFLFVIRQAGGAYEASAFEWAAFIKALNFSSTVLFKDIMLLPSWMGRVGLLCFVPGVIIGAVKHRWVTIYLLTILAGQLLFSTFMTFARIHWFEQRYLVACYVAFSVICAMGAGYLFRMIPQKKYRLALLFILLCAALPASVNSYMKSLKAPLYNPSYETVRALQCKGNKTVVLAYPHYISIIPRYIFRKDPSIIVPKNSSKLKQFILEAATKKYCFIMQGEAKKNQKPSRELETLLSLSGYASKRYYTKPGRHVPSEVWVFRPK